MPLLAPGLLKKIEADPRVAYVEQDGIVQLDPMEMGEDRRACNKYHMSSQILLIYPAGPLILPLAGRWAYLPGHGAN